MSLKFKSFAALALSAAMMFSVAACGTTDSGDAKSDSKAKNTTVGYDVSTIKKDDELAKLAASAKTVKDGELSVGMELSYAPAEFYAEDGKTPVGYDVDMSNELWSYGEENYRIMKKYYDIRISMHDYIKQLYDEASENGSPLIRTMFYEFPDDKKCWELQEQYMFGSEYLVAPIFHLNEFEREVYLPEGRWEDTRDGKVYEGGQTIRAAAPIDSIPVFKKMA